MARSNYRIGVDIGGTFTDLVMLDEETGQVTLVKLSSTPADPSVGFAQVVARALRDAGVAAELVNYLVHGTTVATNAIIESKGARTALLTTAGFRDVLEIARQIRPRLYDLFCDKPTPLVPRRLCLGVPERLDYLGQVLEPLDEAAVRKTVEKLVDAKVESIAVCLLHSYRNPAHEQRVAQIIREVASEVAISLSSELCPEMREYFRTSTTVINALVVPVVARYIERIQERLGQQRVTTPLHLMTSSGGMISAAEARRAPVQMIESGPAAGVTAAAHLGQHAGFVNVISFDMGGTTAKAGLVEGGEPRVAAHFEVGAAAVVEDRAAGYPVRTPVIDLVEIGAGGGSIAWIDPGGALRVGPESAGADPGPACYGNGQPQPTVTDANLVLGRLNPHYFIGGEMQLNVDLARQAVARIAEPLEMDIAAAAQGIIEIANANMLSAIQLVSVQRGFDPREFALVAYGGAGPLHANALARAAGVQQTLIPPSPGVASAWGLLVSDLRHDLVQSFLQETAATDWEALHREFTRLEATAERMLGDEEIAPADRSACHYLDMRYVGQSHELRVELPTWPLCSDDVDLLNAAFRNVHRRAYGYAAEDAPTEIVNLRVVATGRIPHPQMHELPASERSADAAIKQRRRVFFPENDVGDCPIYDRYQLVRGQRLVGPAIIEEIDSTTVLEPGYAAEVDRFGNLIIQTDSSQF